MTIKTITAFDVEAIETGDPNARPCTICHNVRLSHGLDASKTIKSRWAVTNHDDKTAAPAMPATSTWSRR